MLSELLGYEEGSVQKVTCAKAGYFKSVELSFGTFSGFAADEQVALGLRLRCST